MSAQSIVLKYVLARLDDITIRLHRLPRFAYRIGAMGIAGILLITLLVYGVSVQVENRVASLAKETRVMQLDNQDLQIALDRKRSYINIGKASAQIQGLKMADEIIDIAEKPGAAQAIEKAMKARPVRHSLPRDTYGY